MFPSSELTNASSLMERMVSFHFLSFFCLIADSFTDKFLGASSDLTPLTEDMSLSPHLAPILTVNILFKFPLPGSGIKTVCLSPLQLESYHSFSFNNANVMSIALKDINLGYTLPWIKTVKKDIKLGCAVRILNDNDALSNMKNCIRTVSCFRTGVQGENWATMLGFQSITDGNAVTLRSLKAIFDNTQAKSHPCASIVSLFFLLSLT